MWLGCVVCAVLLLLLCCWLYSLSSGRVAISLVFSVTVVFGAGCFHCGKLSLVWLNRLHHKLGLPVHDARSHAVPLGRALGGIGSVPAKSQLEGRAGNVLAVVLDGEQVLFYFHVVV